MGKRARRLTIVAVVAATLAGGGWLVSHERHAVLEASLQSLRTAGLAAQTAGDNAAAVAKLDGYFARHAADVDALLAFAAARAAVDLPDGSHLRRAEQSLLAAEQLAPTSAAVRRALLELLPRTADTATLDRVADEALAADPADSLGLRARMVARVRQDRPQDALDAAIATAKIDPLDLDAHHVVLQMMDRLGRPAPAMAAYAESAFAPADVRRLLLRAMAAAPSDPKHAVATLRQLTAAGPTDLAVVRQAVSLFDALGRPDLSCGLVGQTAARTTDADLAVTYAKRLWQTGDDDTLVAAAGPLASNNPTVVALRAAASYRTNRFEDARRLTAQLAARRDRVSTAWAAALPAAFESPSPIAALKKAAEACPEDGILRTWLADACANAKEPQLAAGHYAAAATLEPAWPEPLFGRARMLAMVGETTDAVIAAQAAYARRPGVDGASALIEIRFAAFDRAADVAAAKDLLAATASVQAARPCELWTLAVRADLLARLDRPEEAAALLKTSTSFASPSDALIRAGDIKSVVRPLDPEPTTQPVAEARREIAHLRLVAGDDGRQWRLAQGRMLADSADPGEVFDAVNLLGDLVYESPRWTPPRMALAHALDRAGNTVGAAEHLKLAVAADPNNPASLAALVRLLRRQGNDADAAEALQRAGRAFAPSLALRQAIATLNDDAGKRVADVTHE